MNKGLDLEHLLSWIALTGGHFVDRNLLGNCLLP